MTRLPVRIATAEDAERVGAVVAECFHDDPLTAWLLPDPADRPRILPSYFGAAGESAVEGGTVYVAGDFDAVAVWFDRTLPADPPPPEPDAHLTELCGPYAQNFHLVDKLMHEAQPSGPAHHQLAFLVVRESLRGRGIGGLLLERHHTILDDAGLPAYLDATHPDSHRLYLRHGYTDLADAYHPPGGAAIWPMWRPART